MKINWFDFAARGIGTRPPPPAAWILFLLLLPAAIVFPAGAAADPETPPMLSITRTPDKSVELLCSPLAFSAYIAQQSHDLIEWSDTQILFGPGHGTRCVLPASASSLFLRLQADQSLTLRCTASNATTLQLNWPPLPKAVEYRAYRDGIFIGSTASRTGFFLDSGLSPGTEYSYAVTAVDAAGQPIKSSETRRFRTTTSGQIRSAFQALVLAFYPDGPPAEELAHIKTYMKHHMDFLRLASRNSAIVRPYKGDVICVRAIPPTLFEGGFNIDYVKLFLTPYPELEGYSVVDLVEKGDVDVVWIAKAPEGCNFHENVLVWNKDLNPNPGGEKWNPVQAKCSRGFFMTGSGEDARLYDAYAHMIEGIMSTICDGHPSNWPRNESYLVYSRTRTDFTTLSPASLHLFERFRLADHWNGGGAYASPGNGNCGSSHFPPNARRETDATYDGDYAYYDLKTWQRYIDCAADDWLSYPDLTGQKRKINGYDFGAFNNYTEGEPSYADALGAAPEQHESFRFATDSYHLWWFSHLPHNTGVANGKLNNWWGYIFDFNQFNGSAIAFPVTGFVEPPTSFPSVNGEFGTEESSADWWGYWHSCTDFGPFGSVTVVNETNQPETVCRGQRALAVSIDQEWFQENGRNDLVFPISRNAHWNLSRAGQITFAIKPQVNATQLNGANPVVRLCANGGNRIEFAPVKNGRYADFLRDSRFDAGNGWRRFTIPLAGSADWERNVIGHVEPGLTGAALDAARQSLREDILSSVNYLEISIRSTGGRGERVVYYVDDLEF